MTKLVKHLPEFVQKIKDFQEEERALSPELELIDEKIKILQDNQFISYANDEALSRYEEMFNINKDSTIEKRRINILSKLQYGANYTWFWLISYLNSLLGAENYTISLENLRLELKIFNKSESLCTLINKDLRNKIPSNISFAMQSISNMDSNLYVSSVVKTATTFSISDNRLTNNATPDLYIGNLVRTATKHSI